jgi:hypothetical protein
MSRIPFDALPDPARLWIFAANRALRPEEQSALAHSVEEGLADWNAHGSPVTWGHRLERDQFLLIGVDETHTALSGCSIDGAVRQIRSLEGRLGVSLLDNARVFYREGDEIRVVARPEFHALAEAGRVDADTVVYNNVLTTVGEFRRGLWEVPVRRSWHLSAFPMKT